MLKLILFSFSYFLGAVPFGFLITRWVKGADIRECGSGNIGATNVFRVAGRQWGVLVFILDFLKGFFPAVILRAVLPQAGDNSIILAGLLAVCGHNWTPFLKFKGGKGVATSLGAVSSFSLIFPDLGLVLILTLMVWAGVFLIFRYVSLASISAGLTFFISSLLFSRNSGIKIIAGFLFMLILVRHKKNIQRLLRKKEHRF